MNIWNQLKKYTSTLLVILLITSFIATPISSSLSVNRAEAGGVVFDPTNLVQNAISAAASKLVAAATDQATFKEMILDPLVWVLINKILEKITADTIKWINSGFNGNPAFVQDFGGFLTQVGDETIGDFLLGTDLAFICSPFNLDIKLALDLQYAASRNYNEKVACSLSGASANVDRFLDGDFMARGWQGWFEMNSNPANNRFGAIALAQQELSARIGNAKYSEKSQLDWGKGLFSQKNCVTVGDGYTECETVTPGTAIENQLNSALDIPKGRLTIADEFNEVLSALFGQVVNQIFSGGAGLLGSTRAGSGPSGFRSVFDDVQVASQTRTDDAPGEVEKAIAIEQRIIALANQVMAPFNNALNYKNATYGVANTCHSGTFPTNSDLNRAYQDALIEAGAKIPVANNNISYLNNLLSRMQAATSEAQLSLLFEEYLDRVASGTLHTQSEVAMLESAIRYALPQTRSLISNFINQVDNACFVNTGNWWNEPTGGI